MSPLRVIQWTTGNIGKRSLHAIIARDDMELVGVYAYGAEKVGVDAAELAGWPEPTGIKATNNIDELIALKPDACCYNPIWPSVDELVALLESGINVCSTAAWITGGKQSPEDLARIQKACETGNSTIVGSGAQQSIFGSWDSGRFSMRFDVTGVGERFSETGREGVLLYISQYNGEADDTEVGVTLVPTVGLFSRLGCDGKERPDAEPPSNEEFERQVQATNDGCDRWKVEDEKLQLIDGMPVPIVGVTTTPARMNDVSTQLISVGEAPVPARICEKMFQRRGPRVAANPERKPSHAADGR